MEASSIRFANAARALTTAARRAELAAPGFRSPPGVDGAQRTIRRHRRGVTVAVVLRDRPWAAVLSDMIDGVAVANGIQGVGADRWRTSAWAALADAGCVSQDQPDSATQRSGGEVVAAA